MATYTLGTRESEFLHYELEPQYTREQVIIAAGQNLPAGAVVGKVTASGEYAAYDNAATDGTESAAGVLLAAVDASGGATEGVILARGPAVVLNRALDWNGQAGAAVTDGQADLVAIGILVR